MKDANFSGSIILRVRHTMKAFATRFWGTVAAVACCFGICNANHSFAMPYGSATVLGATINWKISTSLNPNHTTGATKSQDAAISEVIYTVDLEIEEDLDSSSTPTSIVIPKGLAAKASRLESKDSQAFNACQPKGGQCQPGASGIECRTCGTMDGQASTSTLGMLTCMGLFFAWKLWHRFGF